MRKKFTMLLASLFLCMGAWAFETGTNITDLSSLTDGSYVCFKNVGQSRYLYENTDKKILTGSEASTLAYVWQVHVEEGSKFSFSSVLGNYISTPLDGLDVYTVAVDNEAKDEFVITAHSEDNTKWKLQSSNDTGIYWDCQSARFVGWYGTGTNSRYEIIPVSVTTEEINSYINSYWSNLVETARAAAKAEVELLATESLIYPAATSTVAQIETVNLAENTEAQANEAVATINGYVATYKTEAYKALKGKYFTLYTPGRSAFAKMTVGGTGNAGTASTPDFIWQFVENNGSVNIYNPYIGKYLVMNGTNAMNVTANQAEAGAFDITVASAPSDADAKVGFKSNGWYIHLNGSLLGWYAGGASEWTVTEVTDFSTMVEAYKLSSITALESWATLSEVFDTELINAAETTIDAINTTDWATFAAIDAELVKVTDAKMLTFQTTATDAGRNGVWVSANMSTSKAIGADNKEFNAIWSLRHAGGTSFYMFNEVNQVYMGAPSGKCSLTAEPVAAYSFEIVDAENNIVEMKCNGETMHASNHDDNGLLNYDYDEAASRWYINTVNATITDEIRTAVAELAAVTVPAFNFAAGVNNYDATTQPALNNAVANRTAVLTNFESTTENLTSAKQQLEAAIADVAINMPEDGKFYRVRCTDGNRRILSTINTNDRLSLANTVTDESIYCYTGGALLSYTAGLYMNAYDFNAVGVESAVVFSKAANGTLGCYNVKVGGRYIYGAGEGIDSGTSTDSRAGYNWWLEEVTTLPVTVSAAGYATLYAPVALSIPTEGVTVYTATVNGEYLTLNEVEGAIPANTGVLIEAAEGTYDFTVAENVEAIAGNAFTGALAKSAKNAEKKVYTLQKPAEKEVGFYLFKGYTDEADQENTKTYINGFRAWVELDLDTPAQALRITRGGAEDTTGIEQLVGNNAELVIYDLLGRRVEKMEKGIYIVNGKKVVIK